MRVSVRNADSGADLEDTRTLAITITGGSGKMLRAARLLLARLDPRSWNANRTEAPPLSLSVGSKVVNTTQNTVRYSLYTPELNLMAETAESTSGTPPVAYDSIWFGGQPVAQVDVATSTTHWTFTDPLGTPIMETDATGTPDWRAEYEPYGTVTAYRTGQTRHQPLRFPGQKYDPLAGDRDYNIFRWYGEGWGRYTQADLLGLEAGKNLYVYVYDSPLTNMDPQGLIGLFPYRRCKLIREQIMQTDSPASWPELGDMVRDTLFNVPYATKLKCKWRCYCGHLQNARPKRDKKRPAAMQGHVVPALPWY